MEQNKKLSSKEMVAKLGIDEKKFRIYSMNLMPVINNYVEHIGTGYYYCESLVVVFQLLIELLKTKPLHDSVQQIIKEFGTNLIIESEVSDIDNYLTTSQLYKLLNIKDKNKAVQLLRSIPERSHFSVVKLNNTLYHHSFIKVCQNKMKYNNTLLILDKLNCLNHTIELLTLKELSELVGIGMKLLFEKIDSDDYYKSFRKKVIDSERRNLYFYDKKLANVLKKSLKLVKQNSDELEIKQVTTVGNKDNSFETIKLLKETNIKLEMKVNSLTLEIESLKDRVVVLNKELNSVKQKPLDKLLNKMLGF